MIKIKDKAKITTPFSSKTIQEVRTTLGMELKEQILEHKIGEEFEISAIVETANGKLYNLTNHKNVVKSVPHEFFAVERVGLDLKEST